MAQPRVRITFVHNVRIEHSGKAKTLTTPYNYLSSTKIFVH